ncbi:hypothetical protein [Campylobacter sp.]|uniref:hypothetical protein n=1 Tax=Campylobacter sp. TaxID=205 RepID=UPI002A5F1620|nr:hypothetical protein [Campylobacter sp.]MDD7703619.1 hypothetical protein [Campylobacteraceae bacterium]MDY2635719.1 hypothetical protein [Campylobacter sp.]
MKKFLSVVCLAALFVGCGSEANAAKCPSWRAESQDDMSATLTIRSNDDIVIKKVIVNRGNCEVMLQQDVEKNMENLFQEALKTKGKRFATMTFLTGNVEAIWSYVKGREFPFKEFELKFGQSKGFIAFCASRDILEVKIETNLGECVLPINR